MSRRIDRFDTRLQRARAYAKSPPEGGWGPLLMVEGTLGMVAGIAGLLANGAHLRERVLASVAYGLGALVVGAAIIWVVRFLWGWFWAPSWQRDEARATVRYLRDKYQPHITVAPVPFKQTRWDARVRVTNSGPPEVFDVLVNVLDGNGDEEEPHYAPWQDDWMQQQTLRSGGSGYAIIANVTRAGAFNGVAVEDLWENRTHGLHWNKAPGGGSRTTTVLFDTDVDLKISVLSERDPAESYWTLHVGGLDGEIVTLTPKDQAG